MKLANLFEGIQLDPDEKIHVCIGFDDHISEYVVQANKLAPLYNNDSPEECKEHIMNIGELVGSDADGNFRHDNCELFLDLDNKADIGEFHKQMSFYQI